MARPKPITLSQLAEAVENVNRHAEVVLSTELTSPLYVERKSRLENAKVNTLDLLSLWLHEQGVS